MLPVQTQMKLVQRGAVRLFRMAFTGWGGQAGPGGILRLLLPQARFDYEGEVDRAGGAWRNSAVYNCLRFIQTTITEPRLTVVRTKGRGKQTEIAGHPLTELIRRPNKHYGGKTLLKATALSWNVNGNAYWIKARGAGGVGKPVELWWTPHWMISPQWPTDGSAYISHYVYRVDGKDYNIDPADVVHFRNGIDPHNDRLGLSPLGAVMREIFGDNAASTFEAAILRNMGVPSMIIGPLDKDTSISPDGRALLKQHWIENSTGENVGMPLVPAYPVKAEKLSWSPKELSLGELRHVKEERISGALGLPPILAGFGAGLKHGTFSNYEQAWAQGYYGNVIPTLDDWAETLDVQLLPDFGDTDRQDVLFDRSEVACLQEDRNESEKRSREHWTAGGITRAEYRTAIGQPVVEGRDDVFIAVVQTVPADEPNHPEPADATDDPDDDPPPVDDDDADEEDEEDA